jgi:hypothetical protein
MMPESQPVQLVTAALIDQRGRALFAEGRNYGWELPGAKVKDGDPLASLGWALQDKLGIYVPHNEEYMPLLDEVDVSLAGIEFHAQIRKVGTYIGHPMETKESGYRQTDWINPLTHRLARIGLSPVAESFRKLAVEKPELLVPPSNRVQ